MSRERRRRRAPRQPGSLRRPGRVALALLVAAVPLGSSGMAAAAPAVTPVLECVVPQGSRTFTAVLGYSNTSARTVTVPFGSSNKLTPTRFDGGQPTSFLPGRHRGVFSVRVDHPSVTWMLQGTHLRLDPDASRCPPSTEMPGDGNGTGPVVAVGIAGVVAALLVRRMRGRLDADDVRAGVRTDGEDRDA